jgi:hypothetical protein
MQDELVDYYDESDMKIGSAPKRFVQHKGLLHRHVAFYVRNKDDELILQQRPKDSKANENQFDKPGGHVSSGEDYSPREFFEEVCHGVLGLDYRIISKAGFRAACEEYDLEKTLILYEGLYQKNYPARRVLHDGSIWIENIHLKSFMGKYHGPVVPRPQEVVNKMFFI